MATRTALTPDAYTQVAADVSALTLIQCPRRGNNLNRCIELVVAGSLPAVSDRGIELAQGETIISTVIPDLGSGALYAKVSWGLLSGEVLTL